MNITRHIPNAITLLNLLSGLIASTYAFDDNLQMAFIWVCIGIFFDFWDGFLARILNAKSELGLQLDSLADMVTSGVVPGIIMYKCLSNIIGQEYSNLESENYYLGIVPFLGFIITLGACYRLAKFNIDTRQSNSFIGLPTPANALFIMSLPMITETTNIDFITNILSNPYILILISIFSAYIMNAEIPLFSLKIKDSSWASSKFQYLLLITSIILLVFLQYLAVPLIIILYIALSIIKNKLSTTK